MPVATVCASVAVLSVRCCMSVPKLCPIDQKPLTPGQTYCSSTCRSKASRSKAKAELQAPAKMWRSISGHKDGGYYVIPGICQSPIGPTTCLNPACPKALSRAVQV